MKTIGIEIRNMLLAAEAVYNVVRDRIYPIVAKLDAEMPVIVYRRAEIGVDKRTKFSTTYGDVVYEIAVISSSYTVGFDVAGDVVHALDGNSTASGRSVSLNNWSETFENENYVQIISFNILI